MGFNSGFKGLNNRRSYRVWCKDTTKWTPCVWVVGFAGLHYLNVTVPKQDETLLFELWAVYVATSSLVVCVSLVASQYSYWHVWTLWNTLLYSKLSFFF